MILSQTYQLLKSRHPGLTDHLTIADVRIGVHMTAILLSDGSIGIAATGMESSTPGKKNNRYFGDLSPGKITGCSVSALFEKEEAHRALSCLRIAALNAISSTLITQGNYKVIENKDPIDLIDLSAKKTITLVGAFQSYIRKIIPSGNKLQVLELNEDALTNDQKAFYIPAARYREALSMSDVVIITGYTLVNGTIDNLLKAITDDTIVIVVGPSGNLLPDVLFANKVSIIGATRVTDQQKLFRVVEQGGSGFHLFAHCAQKICILNNQQQQQWAG